MFALTALLALPLSSVNAEIINRIYANVGNRIITQFEIESLNPKGLASIYRRYQGEKRADELKKFYTQALDFLINNYVIEIAAAREGIRISDREVDKAIEDIMERNGVTKDKLEELLEASMKTFEQYKWQIKIDILRARLMTNVFRPKIVVTEEDVLEYIKKHEESLDLSDMYELRMIKVDSKEKLDQAMFDYNVHKSFRDTAMKFSTDSTGANGGYLGWMEISFLDEQIRNAILAKKEGITEAIPDGDGFKLFFVEAFRDKNQVNDEKREKIEMAIRAEISKEIFENWLKDGRSEILIQKKYAN